MYVSSADNFTPDLHPWSLSYHRCYPRPSSHQAVNIFSIDKSIDRHFCFISSFTSSQTFVGANTSWSRNLRICYFYNSCHCLNIAHSLKLMNQELLWLEDWVPLTIPDLQKKFVELPTIDILMIRATPFHTLVQRVSPAKNMEIFIILICNIERALAPKSTTDLAKRIPTKYYNFLNVFSQVDSDILVPHHLYAHEIPLIEGKISL